MEYFSKNTYILAEHSINHLQSKINDKKAYISIRLSGNIGPLVFMSLASWEVIIVRVNFAEKLLSHYLTEVIKSF